MVTTTSRSPMDTQLVQAIAALTAVITNLQRQQQNEQRVQTNTTIMDPFASTQALDLGSRAGSIAHAMARRPPFIQHFKSSPATNATAYKVGATKTWNGETYHFCDCPTHRNKIRWHTHSADSCRTRKRWMEIQSNHKVSANVAHSEDNQGTALLTQALSLANHN